MVCARASGYCSDHHYQTSRFSIPTYKALVTVGWPAIPDLPSHRTDVKGYLQACTLPQTPSDLPCP